MDTQQHLILGLDIGITSVGWALIEEKKGNPNSINAAGVRIFEAGLNLSDTGKGESRNLERQNARQRRRQLFRKAMRRATVRRILCENQALPEGVPAQDSEAWISVLKSDVYTLRAKALDQPLTRTELGRIFYQFAHHRGFLSNRKAPPKKDEKPGEVRKEIDALGEAIRISGARTLGEYLSHLDRTQQRLRGKRTLRKWYREEFEAIWNAQTPHHKDWMTKETRDRLEHALFYQRPLKKQRHLIGFCELEPKKRRASLALLPVQRFRLLQDINHTMVEEPGGAARPFSPDERKKLIDILEQVEDLSFAKARKLLTLKRTSTFNLERAGRKDFIGNGTAARIRDVLGEKWDQADEGVREKIVNDLLSMEDQDALSERIIYRLGVDAVTAESFSNIILEDGHARLSFKAISHLSPYLESGFSYMESVIKAYPDRNQGDAKSQLPPTENLRNPLVQRALAELRHTVNALVRKHGKPGLIRVELARDLKRNAEDRENAWKSARQRESERKDAATEIIRQQGTPQAKAWEIERLLLANECKWKCPYTGEGITMSKLLDPDSPFDIEHIIPFSRCLDNSFANKTLCLADYNRHVKQNRTPFEAAGHTPEWEAIVDRIRNFHGVFAKEKIRRFLLQDVKTEAEFMEDFSKKDLVITQYASRLAHEYLGQLYPADERRKRVQVSAGKTTAYLRSAWKLNSILGSEGKKSRDDHRHHVVDAVVVALTTPASTQALTRSVVTGRAGVFKDMPEPWDGFKSDVEKTLKNVFVSHRVDRHVNGPLHQETFYGLIDDPREKKQKKKTRTAVLRTPLQRLTDADIQKDRIVDSAIRKAVTDKLAELNLPPAKAFQDPINHPYLITTAGRRVPIHRVRVFQDTDPIMVGQDTNRRVKLGNNHHLEVFESTHRKGEQTWRCEIVSLMEAVNRKRNGDPIVSRTDKQGRSLVFSLAIGEPVELTWNGKKEFCIVQKLSEHDYWFRRHNDARKAKDITKDYIRFRSDDQFYQSKCRKLSVDPIGQFHVSRD